MTDRHVSALLLSVALGEPSIDGTIMIGFRLVAAADTSRAARDVMPLAALRAGPAV
jgi:hypothetical protein